MANQNGNRSHVGIVGSGIIGLTTALILSQAGYRVTIVARELPGDDSTKWASPWAGAVILPVATDDDRDKKMQLASFRFYWALAHQDPTSGTQLALLAADSNPKTVKVSEYWDDPNHKSTGAWYEKVIPGCRPLTQDELPPGTFSGNRFTALAVNPDVYLVWIKEKLEAEYAVAFIRAGVASLDQARDMIRCEAVVNASGLGAEQLASDPQVVGVRGQTMLVEPPVDISSPSGLMDKEVKIRRGREYTYVLPRLLSGGVIIGGISDEGNLNTEVSPPLREDIIRRVNIMTNGMFKDVKIKRDIVGIRPDRKGGYRLERTGKVVHAYGFGGAGFRYSVGAAQVVKAYIDQLLADQALSLFSKL
ncbi:hypothetical protein LTS17_005161 [Exophiala oligosperma]